MCTLLPSLLLLLLPLALAQYGNYGWLGARDPYLSSSQFGYPLTTGYGYPYSAMGLYNGAQYAGVNPQRYYQMNGALLSNYPYSNALTNANYPYYRGYPYSNAGYGSYPAMGYPYKKS